MTLQVPVVRRGPDNPTSLDVRLGHDAGPDKGSTQKILTSKWWCGSKNGDFFSHGKPIAGNDFHPGSEGVTGRSRYIGNMIS